MLVEQILILLPLVLGCYISYHTLKVTDLSIDGTYVLGAAIFAITIRYGVMFALLLSMLAGVTVGVVVSLMQKQDKVNDLLVGILVSFMLYSTNLQIMGKPNISLIYSENLLSLLGITDNWYIPLLIVGTFIIIIFLCLLKSELGLLLKAFGENRKLLNYFGLRIEKYRLIGLMFSGALASLSGALASQVNGFADINMGFGIALTGIGAVVIGKHLLSNIVNFTPIYEVVACILGITIYFALLAILVQVNLDPINIKMALALILFVILRKYSR